MRPLRLTRSAALGLTIAAFAAQTAAAQQQDLRSPDARDASAAAQARQDFRSPDARDASAGRGTFNAPQVTIVKVPSAAPSPNGAGLDWGDAGIGAGAVVAMILLAAGGVFVVVRRRPPAGIGTAATG